MNRRLGPRAGAVLVAALDRLIPGDEFGPSATDAGVGHYIEGMFGRADPSLRADWRRSLEQLDDLALARAGAGFAELDEATQHDLLEAVAADGTPASESAAAFFEMLRLRAIEGYFGDPRWGGNAGRAGWAMLGYEGPRLVWSAYDQRLESLLSS
ncbi:MAG TPA: gluconate 2-dehydrogenase subunit 3 family protein [Gaiellaceae bacterium]|jgi:gluconate 2-dehydrogenase gamma chain|nr:gluconate 2-dehydrogenase subunit 3 family protein [Gaiellaceae bacterium]